MKQDNKIDIFLKLKKDVIACSKQILLLEDIAEIVAPAVVESRLKKVIIKEILEEPEKSVVINVLEIIRQIKEEFPAAQINQLGAKNVVVDVVANEQQDDVALLSNTKPSLLFVFLVGVILFVGSGMAIMHFHADVNINLVHQEVYRLIMGQEKTQPLLLEIPYSLGIACGMIIFFNNFLNYKFDKDPSPLEIEMFLYEDKVNQYAVYQNTKKVTTRAEDSS
ncbi:MAG: stage V sporulation protein AA [Bacillota bacterium]